MRFADWLGHSVNIAKKHYLQVTEEHHKRALEFRAKTNVFATTDVTPCKQSSNLTKTSGTLSTPTFDVTCCNITPNDQKTVAQKASQTPLAGLGNSLKVGEIDISVKKQLQVVTSFVCKGLQPVSTADEISSVFQKNILADGEGFEPTVRSPVRRFSRPVP